MSIKSRFSHAVNSLFMYTGIMRRQDVLNTLIAGTEPEQQADTRLKIIKGEEKLSPSELDITDLFQGQERGFCAYEIVEKLEEFKNGEGKGEASAELDKAINVICNKEVSFGEFPYKPLKGGKPTTDLDVFSHGLQKIKIAKKKMHLAINNEAKELNQSPKEPSKEKPTLSALVINNSMMNPGVRQCDGAAIFMNSIPTIEMSRCVPYLDIVLSTGAPPLDPEDRVNSISLLQFFGGNFKATDTNKQIATSYDVSTKDFVAPKSATEEVQGKAKAGELPTKGSAGMEIFTTPQTLVRGDEPYLGDGNSARAAPVIDRFRPFMSLVSFKVDIAPSVGLIAMKTASLSLVLHDRSRLAEIAELIKPDLFSSTELIITYGWSHPDGMRGINVWGEFLDSLKCTEKFGITNSQFSFDEVGQVNINIKLSLKGSVDEKTVKIADGEGIQGSQTAMAKIQKAMRLFRKKNPKYKEIKGKYGRKSKTVNYEFNISDVSSTRSIMKLDEKTQKQVEAYIKKSKSGRADDKELAGILKDWLEQKKKTQSLITEAINRKMSSLSIIKALGHSAAADKIYEVGSLKTGKDGPFADPFIVEINRQKKKINCGKVVKRKRKGKKGTEFIKDDNSLEYTSFGALLLQFVGRPLASTGNFDEVQFVFYPFNDKASYMANLPVCNFPIKIDEFKSAYTKASIVSANMGIGQFIGFVGSKFISAKNAEAYGFESFYEPDKEDANKMVLKDKYDDDRKAFLDARDEVLCDAAGDEHWGKYQEYKKSKGKGTPPQTKFRNPRLQYVKECLKGKSDDVTILRIHVYDAALSSFSTLADIWKDAQSDSLSGISTYFSSAVKETKEGPKKKAFTDFIKKALKSKVVAYVDDEDTTSFDPAKDADKPLKVVAGALATKSLIKQFIPSIDYGNATSNVLNASVSSNMTPGLGDINIMRAGLGSGLTSLGTRDSGLPLAVAPVSLSISSHGFPFAAFSQQFFIDFNTGTNVDNIYRCSKISHSIDPGSFKTDMSFVQLNAYGQYTNLASQISVAVKEIESKTK